MSKRGSWPQRLVCKRKGHRERAYRIYRSLMGGSIGVLEPHCERCGIDFPMPVFSEPPAHAALRRVPSPGGLPPSEVWAATTAAPPGEVPSMPPIPHGVIFQARATVPVEALAGDRQIPMTWTNPDGLTQVRVQGDGSHTWWQRDVIGENWRQIGGRAC